MCHPLRFHLRTLGAPRPWGSLFGIGRPVPSQAAAWQTPDRWRSPAPHHLGTGTMDFRHKRGPLQAQPGACDARRAKGLTPSAGPLRPGQGASAERQAAQKTPATRVQPRAAARLHTAPHAFGSRAPVPATPRGGVRAWVVPLALAAALHTAVCHHPMPPAPGHWLPRGVHQTGAEAAERHATPAPKTETLAPGVTRDPQTGVVKRVIHPDFDPSHAASLRQKGLAVDTAYERQCAGAKRLLGAPGVQFATDGTYQGLDPWRVTPEALQIAIDSQLLTPEVGQRYQQQRAALAGLQALQRQGKPFGGEFDPATGAIRQLTPNAQYRDTIHGAHVEVLLGKAARERQRDQSLALARLFEQAPATVVERRDGTIWRLHPSAHYPGEYHRLVIASGYPEDTAGRTLTQSLALAELRRLGAPGVSIDTEDGRLKWLMIDAAFAASQDVETYKELLRQVGYRAEDVEQHVASCKALGVVIKMPGMNTIQVRSDGSITAQMFWHREQTSQDYEALRRLGLPTPQPPPGSVPELTRDAETLAQWSTLHRRLEQKPGVLRLFESAAAGKVPGITIGHAGNVTVNLDLPRTPRARAEAQHIQDNLVDFNTYLSLRPLIDDLRSRHSGTR
jgi:hypothetical protein